VNSPRRRPLLRPLARRVHFLASVFVAPFLVLACLTGLLYVISPQIHEGLYKNQLNAVQRDWPIRPLDEQVAAALTGHPEAQLDSVLRPERGDRTTWVNLKTPGLAPGDTRTVFVDPYTDYVNGELTTQSGRLPANVWLRHFHTDLQLGGPGAVYVSLAASWLVIILVTGLVLWFAKQGRRPRTARTLLAPAVRREPPALRLRALHGGMGLYLTLGLLAIGLTGTLMSGYTKPLFDAKAPTLVTTPLAEPPGAQSISLDTALDVARAAGLHGNLEVRPPADPTQPIRVSEQAAAGMPAGVDTIAVDPYSGQVIASVTWADYPLGAKLMWLSTQFHTGVLFGLANQILLAVLVVGLLGIIVTGYRMWWRRSPYSNPLSSAPPVMWRALGPSRLALVVAVTLGLGLVSPVLGASLVGFLIVDSVWRKVSAWRTRRVAPQRSEEDLVGAR